jgi:hypothetical protein
MGSISALDIDLLRSVVLIAEGGSFTPATGRVGRTQFAVSQQIRRAAEVAPVGIAPVVGETFLAGARILGLPE